MLPPTTSRQRPSSSAEVRRSGSEMKASSRSSSQPVTLVRARPCPGGSDPPTPFAREGWLIAAVRSALLLAGGWTWRDADLAAREVTHEALKAIGAKRPTWKEASTPHYAQADAFSLYKRTRCRQCGWKLPEENRLFCTPNCKAAYHIALRRAELAAWEAMIAEGL